MRIVIIGAPASGKSTLTDGLTDLDPALQTYGVRRAFAAEVEAGTSLGRRAEPYVRRNAWIPDELVIEGVAEAIDARLGTSFLLEGVPANQRQAELLDQALEARGTPLHAAVFVDTPFSECRARAGSRLVCFTCDGGSHQVRLDGDGHCGRCGSTPGRRVTDAGAGLTERLRLHAAHVDALVAHYEGPRLVRVDGTASVDEVLASTLASLRERTGVLR